MQSLEPVPLRDRLLAAANAWCDATGKSVGSLSTRATGTGKTLDQLASGEVKAITDTKLAQFAEWLADPANWPEGGVAEEARALAHVVGVSLPDAGASAGNAGELSGPSTARPAASAAQDEREAAA